VDTVWYRAILLLRTSELCILCDRSVVLRRRFCSATVFKDCVFLLLLLLLPTAVAAASNPRTEWPTKPTASVAVDDCRSTILLLLAKPKQEREDREEDVMCRSSPSPPRSFSLHYVFYLPHAIY
jgi:hypothetical protein